MERGPSDFAWQFAFDLAAHLAAAVTPARLLLGLLAWSVLSVLLVGGLGAWIATRRAGRHRR